MNRFEADMFRKWLRLVVFYRRLLRTELAGHAEGNGFKEAQRT